MDPLSETLALFPPHRCSTAEVDAGGEWAIALDDLAGQIKCYVVVRGALWLSVEDGDGPVHVPEGSCLVMPTGRGAVIGSGPDIAPRPASEVLGSDRRGRVITHPWTVQKLATVAGLSRTGFAELFRARTGETPIAWLTHRRMTVAAERLRAGETVGRIARSLGYESENSFNTAFKRVMGLPPGRYARTTS